MKTYKELEEEFNKKVKNLQKKCKHQIVSGWIDEWWAPGHFTGNQIRRCEFCNKVIEKKRLEWETKQQ